MPGDWRWVPIRDCILSEFPGEWGTDPTAGGNATILRSTDLDDDGHVLKSAGARRQIPKQKIHGKKLQNGDILVEASGGGPGKPVGRVALFQEDGGGPYLSSNFFRTLRPSSLADSEFLFWMLHHLHRSPAIWRFQQQTTGIINLKLKDYLGHSIPLPPLPEQRRIADILDTVDEAIRKTEQVITKLKQMKQGLLHDLLTRGIDEHGELREPVRHPEQFKDSPLGRIPREWEVLHLGGALETAIDGPFGSNLKTEHYVDEGGVRVVRLQNIGVGEFNDADQAFISDEHAAKLARHQVVAGDLVVGSLGDDTHPIARACIYPSHLSPGIVKADCFRLRVKYEAGTNDFISLVLNCPSTRGDLGGLAQGVTRDRVNLTTLQHVRVALPPVPEQHRINDCVDALARRIRAEEATGMKCRALKAGLMDDLLMGRVRVKVPPEAA